MAVAALPQSVAHLQCNCSDHRKSSIEIRNKKGDFANLSERKKSLILTKLV